MKKNKKSKKSSGGNKSGVDFGKYLRGLNKHLEEAKEKAGEQGFEEFDDGKYKARCVDAKIGVSKNKRVQVILTWKFMGGDYKGKEKLDFEGLVEDHLPYLLKKLDAMGYDTADLENLEEELKEILDDIKKTKPECKITLKTKGEFQNVYVDNLLSEDDGEEEEDEDEDEDSDDEDEDDDEDDKKSKKSKKSKSKKKDKDEDDEEEEDEEESDDDDDDSDDDDEDEEEDEDADDDEEEKPKKKGKKKSKEKDEEEEEEEDEEDEDEEEVEDEVEVVVGSVVKAESKKLGKIKGEVVELFESEGKILLKTDKGKTIKIKADAITSVEESPAESVPKKKKKSKK